MVECAESVLSSPELKSDDRPLDMCPGTGGRRDSKRWCGNTTAGVVIVVACVNESTENPTTCLVGGALSLGDIRPLLGDLWGGS